ncbi:cellulase family glycosylhydrolase, partial [Saccharomonospora saliphila]|uniref:cellulase family glycosylhydrolase n=1 Tax=Saccharomonospora saliphila TaxID=369829 RepID=UPI0018DC9181
MRDNAAEVFASDPARDTVFSVHMYGVYDTAWRVRDYLTAFTRAGLPIMVGSSGTGTPTVTRTRTRSWRRRGELGVGYLGWSWSGNSGGVDYLDLVHDFDPARLTGWGQRLFHGPDGIGETAEEAAV